MAAPPTPPAADLFDFDSDAFVNLLERARWKSTATSSALIQVGIVINKLTITFTRSTANRDLTLTVQGADNPSGPWTDLARSSNGGAFSPQVTDAAVNETGTGSLRAVEVQRPDHPRRFLRLMVER